MVWGLFYGTLLSSGQITSVLDYWPLHQKGLAETGEDGLEKDACGRCLTLCLYYVGPYRLMRALNTYARIRRLFSGQDLCEFRQRTDTESLNRAAYYSLQHTQSQLNNTSA
jgi:hypothetical protein